MPGKSRRAYPKRDAYLDDPKIRNYLIAFDAWLAAGSGRNDKLVRELKQVCVDDLIGNRPRRHRPYPKSSRPFGHPQDDTVLKVANLLRLLDE